MVEAFFHTLSPTSLPLPSSCTFPIRRPIKAKAPHDGFIFSRKKRIKIESFKGETSRDSELSNVSTRKRDFLQRDWPQLLQVSIGAKDFGLAQSIHGFLMKSDCRDELFVGNNLVNLYAKFDKMGDAQRIFDEMLVRNTITWTTLMKGYLMNGKFESVFQIAHDMYMLEEKFNEHTCSVVLQACKYPEDLVHGEQIHAFVIKNGLEENVVLATSLVSMYSRSGCLGQAEKLFNGIVVKDVQCINYMILEYGNAGLGNKAFYIFIDLLNHGLKPNNYTFTNMISACDSNIGFHEAKQLHGLALKYGFMGKTSLGNALITMYGQHGMIREAERMFEEMDQRSLISWSALLSAFVKNGYAKKALVFFLDLLEIDMNLDSVCFSTVVDGCSECNNLEFGIQIHALTIKLGRVNDVNIGTAFIDLYAKCGSFQSARVVFDRLPTKTIASFNAILVGYPNSTIRDDDEDPMVFFNNMRFCGVKPDWVTFSRLLSLSADEACLGTGKSVHAYAIKMGLEADSVIGNAMITMYAKCGDIHDAYEIFGCKDSRDQVTWNAIVSAYALHGEGNKVLSLFEEMKEEGFAPDEITILSVLQACSCSSLWETGICLFDEMEPKYGIKPVIEHYACMVDLLGRTGKPLKAMDVIGKSPFSNSPLLWRTLVNACKLRGDIQLGMLASRKLIDLAPNEASSYILVSNMYAGGGMPEEAAKVRTIMNDLKLIKETGSSWIEVDNEVHYFVASDRYHPQIKEIYANLDLLRDDIDWSCKNRNDLQLL